MVLEYFNEATSKDEVSVKGQCCDVCSQADAVEMVDCQKQIAAIAQVVEEIPNVGEKKVSTITK